MSKIVVALNGGLGNQLWGWAAGYSLAKRLNFTLVLDCSGLHQRGYQLSRIETGASVWRDHPINYQPGVYSLNRLYDYLTTTSKIHLFREEGFSYDKRFSQINKPTKLLGYYQSPRYFSGLEPDIRQRILTEENVERSTKSANLQFISQPFVAVHVRLGDYLASREVFPELDTSYFEKAISLARERFPDSSVVAFTDSPDLCRKLLPSADFFLGPEIISDPLENLMIMSNASALIGSNSSFSWWAAFLLNNPEAPRIMPRNWFTDSSINTSELFLDAWYQL